MPTHQELRHFERITLKQAFRIFPTMDSRLIPDFLPVTFRDVRGTLVLESDWPEVPPAITVDLQNSYRPGAAVDPWLLLENVRANQCLHEALNRDYPDRVSVALSSAACGDHLVVPVLQFSGEAARMKEMLALRGYPTALQRTSLIGAAIHRFLLGCATAMRKGLTDQALADFLCSDPLDEVKAAGKHFVHWLGRPGPRDSFVLRQLYSALIPIAAQGYEKAEASGSIVLASPDSRALAPGYVKLSSPVRLLQSRGARKLLEMTRHGLSLLSDGQYLYGLGQLKDHPAEQLRDLDPNIVEFRFRGKGNWSVWYEKQEVLKVRYGIPYLPDHAEPNVEGGRNDTTQGVSETEIDRALRFLFNIPLTDRDRLVNLAMEATKAQKGALLLVMPRAGSEANRLKKQSTRIAPRPMTPELMHGAVAIDGAILVDTKGNCHALGVILDGVASAKGLASRGARYNSAVRYVHTRFRRSNTPCLALVVSEDGSVDLVPSLMELLLRNRAGAAAVLASVSAMSPAEHQFFTAVLQKQSVAVQYQVNGDPTLVRVDTASGWTALHVAALLGDAATCRVLIGSGANVHAVTADSLALEPLHAAVISGSIPAMDVMINAHANILNLAQGWSVTHFAAWLDDKAMIHHLNALEADLDAWSPQIGSVYEVALAERHRDSAELVATLWAERMENL